jgi:hypothetical protein
VFSIASYFPSIFFVVGKKHYRLFRRKLTPEKKIIWQKCINGFAYVLQKHKLRLRRPKVFFKRIDYFLEVK